MKEKIKWTFYFKLNLIQYILRFFDLLCRKTFNVVKFKYKNNRHIVDLIWQIMDNLSLSVGDIFVSSGNAKKWCSPEGLAFEKRRVMPTNNLHLEFRRIPLNKIYFHFRTNLSEVMNVSYHNFLCLRKISM